MVSVDGGDDDIDFKEVSDHHEACDQFDHIEVFVASFEIILHEA